MSILCFHLLEIGCTSRFPVEQDESIGTLHQTKGMLLAQPRRRPPCFPCCSRLLETWFCSNTQPQTSFTRTTSTRGPFYSYRGFNTTSICRKPRRSGRRKPSETKDDDALFLEEAAQRTAGSSLSSSLNDFGPRLDHNRTGGHKQPLKGSGRRTPSKKYDDDARYLEEAAQRTTGRNLSSSLNDLGRSLDHNRTGDDKRPLKDSVEYNRSRAYGQRDSGAHAVDERKRNNNRRDWDVVGNVGSRSNSQTSLNDGAGRNKRRDGEYVETGTLLRRWYQEALEHLQAHQDKKKSQYNATGQKTEGNKLIRSHRPYPASNDAQNYRETLSSLGISRTDVPLAKRLNRSSTGHEFSKRQPTDLNRRKYSTSGTIGMNRRSYTSYPPPSSQLFPENQVLETTSPVEPISKRLPISPYQRLQAKKPQMKARVDAASRLRLAHNPWAQLLASPVRRCQATAVRMPNKLLVPWNLVRNPRDDQVYLMPGDLADMSRLESVPEPQPSMSAMGIVPAEVEDKSGQTGVGKNSLSDGDVAQIKPAKIWLRPSSIVLSGLNKLFGTSTEAKIETGLSTRPGTVSRILTLRLKDQARRFQKSEVVNRPDAGFLTERDMRRVQWHANIMETMRDLLCLRLLKALKLYATVHSRDQHSNGRIIPLWSDATDRRGQEKVDFGSLRTSQAVLFWLGTDTISKDSSSSSSPISVSHCNEFSLGFVRYQQPDRQNEQIYTPRWTRCDFPYTPVETTLNSLLAQKAHNPPSIRLDLPPYLEVVPPTHVTSSSSAPSVHPGTHIHIPVFDLTSLLGPTQSQAMQNDPLLTKTFALSPTCPSASSGGWVLVMAGDGSESTEEEYKSLVQELWRLWIFQGGRGGMESGDGVNQAEHVSVEDADGGD